MEKMTKDSMKQAIIDKLRLNFGCTEEEATEANMMKACAMVLRDRMSAHAVETRSKVRKQQLRQVHYMSPVVGELQLLAVHDLLLEDAQLVADGVAVGGDLQGGQAVQIAGRQTAQAAVAQARVGLHVENMGGLEAQLLDGLTHGLDDAQVVGVLHQAAAHEELQGHIVDLPELLLADLGTGLYGGANLRKAGMTEDFSWSRSAQAYNDIYQRIRS